MAEIYIAFVDTPGIFAAVIRRVLRQKYVHVVIALDPYLAEAYSIGRRNPAIPIFAGFEKEEKEKIIAVFPEAEYLVCGLQCTEFQKLCIEKQLFEMYERRKTVHYTVLGLLFIWMQIPFRQTNHFTCSSYIARLLQENGVLQWEKDTSIVTPKDFYQLQNRRVCFEGKLHKLIREEAVSRNRLGKLIAGDIIYE